MDTIKYINSAAKLTDQTGSYLHTSMSYKHDKAVDSLYFAFNKIFEIFGTVNYYIRHMKVYLFNN